MTKNRKKQLQKAKDSCARKCAFWTIVLEQTDFDVAEIDKRILALQQRREKMLSDKAVAPKRLEDTRKEYARIATQLAEPTHIDNRIEKFLAITAKMERYRNELADLDLKPEQIALLKKASNM
jgi:hypothetical protein